MKTFFSKCLHSLALMILIIQASLSGCTQQTPTIVSTSTAIGITQTNLPHQITRIATVPKDCVLWEVSPDVKWMVFQCDPGGELMIEEIDKEEITTLFRAKEPRAGYYPLAFSPDGTKLIVIDIRDGGPVWLFDVGQWHSPKMLYPETQPRSNPNPTWSPDSQLVAISYLKKGVALSIMDLNGNVRDVLAYSDVHKEVESAVNMFGPTWSLDSKEIVYTVIDLFHNKRPTQLWLLDVASGKKEMLYSGKSAETGLCIPNWSPDGKNIALAQPFLEPYALYIYDLNKGIMFAVQDFHTGFLYKWSPDGKNIGVRTESGILYVVSVASRKSEYIGYYNLLGWKDKDNILVIKNNVLEVISL